MLANRCRCRRKDMGADKLFQLKFNWLKKMDVVDANDVGLRDDTAVVHYD